MLSPISSGSPKPLPRESKVADASPVPVQDQVILGEASTPAPVRETSVVDRAMTALGIDIDAKTDPAVVRKVLADLKLLDFKTSYPPMQEFLRTAERQPLPMGPMLRRVRQGLDEDHPAIRDFLSVALDRGWLSPGEEVTSSLHTGYVLEALTMAMANNPTFCEELRDHWLSKRAEYGINPHSALSTFWHMLKTTRSPFMAAKTISVDPAVSEMVYTELNHGKALSEEEVNALYKNGHITGLDRRMLKRSAAPTRRTGLETNIQEADLASLRMGYRDNALAGHVLEAVVDSQGASASTWMAEPVLPRSGSSEPGLTSIHSVILDEKRPTWFPKYADNAAWVEGYTTWNAAFVLSELPEKFGYLLPKLLIPSVLCAKPENYIGTRTLALWASINRVMFEQLDGGAGGKKPAHAEDMARVWGEINKKYALQYAASAGLNAHQVEQDFGRWARHPLWSFAKRAAGLFTTRPASK